MAMTQLQRPTLVTNPTDDAQFASAAEAALEDGQTPEDLEALLRRDFPRVVVRARDLAGERLVWYVYREGRWVSRNDRT